MNTEQKKKKVEQVTTKFLLRLSSRSITQDADLSEIISEFIKDYQKIEDESNVFTVPRQTRGESIYFISPKSLYDTAKESLFDNTIEVGHSMDDKLYSSGNYFFTSEERDFVAGYFRTWLKLYHFARRCDWEGYMFRRLAENTMYHSLYTIDFDSNNNLVPLAYYVSYLDQFGMILFPTEEELKKAWDSLTEEEQRAYINFHTNGNIKFGGTK